MAGKLIGRDYGQNAELVFSLHDSAVGGRLAGGVAHHYNNLLGGMLGFVALAPSLQPDELSGLCTRLQRQIEEASKLTSTLLAVTRSGTRSSGGNDVCELCAKTEELVRLSRACGGSTIDVRSETPSTEVWAAIPGLTYSRALLGVIVGELEALREARSTAPINVSIEVDADVAIVCVTSALALPSEPPAGGDTGSDAVRSLALVAARRSVGAVGGEVERREENGGTRYRLQLPCVSSR